MNNDEGVFAVNTTDGTVVNYFFDLLGIGNNNWDHIAVSDTKMLVSGTVTLVFNLPLSLAPPSLKIILTSTMGIILSSGDYLVWELDGLCAFNNLGSRVWRINLGVPVFFPQLGKSNTAAYWLSKNAGEMFFGKHLNGGTLVFAKRVVIPLVSPGDDHAVFVTSTRVIFYISINAPNFGGHLFAYDLDSNELVSAVDMDYN